VDAVVLFGWALRRTIARTKHALEFNRSEFPQQAQAVEELLAVFETLGDLSNGLGVSGSGSIPMAAVPW
jgi:hypothetical protein